MTNKQKVALITRLNQLGWHISKSLHEGLKLAYADMPRLLAFN